MVKFHGPTIMAEVIKNATDYAESECNDSENQKYFILLIVTDGNLI